ncbi:hypothetical protein RZN05_09430 [Sphingomonas sp. HF-S4]|uniref:HPt domain-containing protein n=1 Tax=Sphingomonas agrestis TaxID=3080540 RepID=A0ABU3Y7A6_9SPHN|nr:hypothetical protein [Sphingomonas sp. HF-S4]MDV3457202.1 hypothetical protein [Sphingomonas sp. HF-S4]
MRPYQPYIPQTPGEIRDQIGSMILSAPRFIDSSGYFLGQNIATEFHALTEGFGVIRKKLGEERYAKLIALAAHAKAHFGETSDDDLDGIRAGCAMLFEMEDIIDELRRGKQASATDPA